MAEHTYPRSLPRDDPRPSVQLAWTILDSVRPGVIPPIVRFDLAAKIVAAFTHIDNLVESKKT